MRDQRYRHYEPRRSARRLAIHGRRHRHRRARGGSRRRHQQVAGKIQSLGVDPRDAGKTIDYGSPVNVGTVLAQIDDALYLSDVEQARPR